MRKVSSMIGTVTAASEGRVTFAASSGTLRIICLTPASIPSRLPRITLPGVTLFVAHPSSSSTASSTISKRSARSETT